MPRPSVATVWALLMAGGVAHAQNNPDKHVTLRGMVLDTVLRPLPGALVYLSTARAFAVTDDAGRFTLADIETRTDTLQVRARGFTPRAFRIDLRDVARDAIDLGPAVLDAGPPPTLTLTATVRDTVQRGPVAGAEVLLNDRPVGETDATGTYAAVGLHVDWGINVMLIRRLGYAPLFASIWVEELSARKSLTGIMQPQAVELGEVVVEADRIRFSFAGPQEFWRRRRFGQGRFFTRTDIERRRATRVTDMFLGIPYLSVRRGFATTSLQTTLNGGLCDIRVWLNGSPLPLGENLDAYVHARDVTAIEVYRGFEIPVQYGGLNSCGVILVWTS